MKITVINGANETSKTAELAGDVTLREFGDALEADNFAKKGEKGFQFVSKRTSEQLAENVPLDQLDIIDGDAIELYGGAIVA